MKMDIETKKIILGVIEELSEAIKKQDSVRLGEIFNKKIKNFDISQEGVLISLSLITYALKKLIERKKTNDYKNWDQIFSQIITSFNLLGVQINKEDKRAVIALSGGIDSIAVFYWLTENKWKLYPIYIDFDLPDSKAEKRVLNKVTDYKHVAVNIKSFHDEGSYILNRTNIILSIASSYAKTLGIKNIAMGNLRSDSANDLQNQYIMNFAKSLNINVISPFCGFSKTDVLHLMKYCGKENEMIANTWSCWISSKKHCNACDGCGERLQALYQSGIFKTKRRKK